jgi:hypothetical protein
MKKLNLNIVLKKPEKVPELDDEGHIVQIDKVDDKGNTVKDAKGNVVKEVSMKELTPVESALNWIENSIIRVMNGMSIDRRPTKQPKLSDKAKWRKVYQALEGHKDGIVYLETDDYTYLDETFHKVEQVADATVDTILFAISDAIKSAEEYNPNKDKE